MRYVACIQNPGKLIVCAALASTLLLGNVMLGQTDSSRIKDSPNAPAVVLGGDTLFVVRTNLGPFTPGQRASAINERLLDVVRNMITDSLTVVESSEGAIIRADTAVIMLVTDTDAALAGTSREELARSYAAILHAHLRKEIEHYGSTSLIVGVGMVIGLLVVLAFAFWVLAKLFPTLYAGLEKWEGTVFRPIRVRSQEILSASSISAVFIVVAKGVRLAISLLLIYFFLTYSLSLFPLTSQWNVRPILVGTLLVILTTAAAVVLFRTLRSFFGMLIRRVASWRGSLIKSVRLKTVEVLSEDRIAEAVRGGFKILKLFSYVALGYFYITILFSFFEFTQTWAGTLVGYIVNPLWNVVGGFVRFLPNLFFILVIAYVTRYVIKLIKLIFDEIGKGTLALPGFYREWADPTYKIVRFLILAFAGIVIFPYLPGSDSPVFKGVSVFLGILFSLGSTSAIANVVAGAVITYMRPFKIGDRVRIADTMGDVVEKTLLVTRVRTIKNVDVTIPNAMVLGSHIINFSSSAQTPGLILHTSVTIGYDTPWQKVHELLIAAAQSTDQVLKEPAPFVLQTSLDDSYVSYELNAYTDEPNTMAKTYSDLHQNIQNKFNEARVEIMSPHYTAVRDGNKTAIPADYLPRSYEAPAFRVFSPDRFLNKSKRQP